MQLYQTTYRDIIEHILDVFGAATDATTERSARRAIQSAYVELQNKRNWVYYQHRNRLYTVVPQTSANTANTTVQYQHSSGIIPRMVTITGGTWPSWAGDGTILFGTGISISIPGANIPCIVSSRISDTVLQLFSTSNPGQDIDAGASYTLYQDTYTLPVDYGAQGEFVSMGYSRILNYQTPANFVALQRTMVSPAHPYYWTTKGDNHRYGALAAQFYPPPDLLYCFDYGYRRRPRQLLVDGYTTGTATITSAGTTVTGTGTTWTAAMVGSVIRFAPDTANVPTGFGGANPLAVERTIASFTNAQSLELDQVPGMDLTGVAYSISDPVDIEPGAMLNYFFREAEKQMRIIRRVKEVNNESLQYREALLSAFDADSRHYENRSTGSGGMWPASIQNMPRGSDVI